MGGGDSRISPATLTPIVVGRDHEVESLRRALNSVQNGRGGCMLLAGEAGIGKSRLASEMIEQANSEQFYVWKGFCSEQENALPYAAWLDALRAFLSQLNAQEVGDVLNGFAPELVKLLPELSLILPSINPSPTLEAAAEKYRLFETLYRLAISLTASHPLLIVLEDLHWSDEQSLELLQHFARRLTTHPILILGTYRSDDHSPRLERYLSKMKLAHLVEEIRLSGLSRHEVSQMVQAILKNESSINTEWLDWIMRLTEGNPFFIEEMVQSAPPTGGQPAKWDELEIPINLQHMLLQRVGDLPEKTRTVLSLASVIGERFDFALLGEVAGEDEQALMAMLKEMISAQLIIERSADIYAFHHALTRQAVYESLMLRERQAMHQVIGCALEQIVSGRAETQMASLAYHFYQAGDWQKALKYSQAAGEQAQSLHAPREALAHFSNALEAARQLGIRAPNLVLSGRAQANNLTGYLEEARSDYEALITQAKDDGDAKAEWAALINLGYVWQPRDLKQAGEYFRQALELAESLDDAPMRARSLNRLGSWYFFRSQPTEALPLLHQALEIFEQLGDRSGLAETLQLLGTVSYGTGNIILGVAYYEQAIPLLRQADDLQGLVRALEFLSMRARLDTEVRGEISLTQLVGYSEQAYEIAHSFNWREGEGEALSRGAICWSKMGKSAKAQDLLMRAMMIGEEIDHRHLLTSVNLLLGELYLEIFALDQARQHLELAFALAQEVGALQLLKSVEPLLVNLCILQHDIPRAKVVLAVLSSTEDNAEIAQAGAFDRLVWSAQAELELALGEPGRALEIIDCLINTAQNISEYGLHAIPWLSQLRAQALVELGSLEEASAELIGAQATILSWGAQPLMWRLHTDLGKVFRKLGRRAEAEKEFELARAIINDLAVNVPEGELRENYLYQALATIPAAHVPTRRQATKHEFGGLTAREREIAALIMQGRSNRDIARELFISEKTAERHVANILLKLGFNTRSQIAAWAVEKGLNK